MLSVKNIYVFSEKAVFLGIVMSFIIVGLKVIPVEDVHLIYGAISFLVSSALYWLLYSLGFLDKDLVSVEDVINLKTKEIIVYILCFLVISLVGYFYPTLKVFLFALFVLFSMAVVLIMRLSKYIVKSMPVL